MRYLFLLLFLGIPLFLSGCTQRTDSSLETKRSPSEQRPDSTPIDQLPSDPTLFPTATLKDAPPTAE